jgi:hypothetical protein
MIKRRFFECRHRRAKDWQNFLEAPLTVSLRQAGASPGRSDEFGPQLIGH